MSTKTAVVSEGAKLKPCPFCDGPVCRDCTDDCYHSPISCSECGISLLMSDEDWNRRTISGIADPERALREVREALGMLIKRQSWFLSMTEGQFYSGHVKTAMDELAMGVEALALLSPKGAA